MSEPDTHTPLEMLLLFQTLDPSDPTPPSFTKLSDSLKNNVLLRESASYDPSRLDPDSLKQLYLRLVKEEATIDVNAVDKAKYDKDGQPNPHPATLSSPLLDSVNEFCRHVTMLPSLLNRLYFRYRFHAIKAIEDEEYNFRRLQRDIQEIDRGEWDARLQLEEINSKKDAKGGVPSIHTLLRHDSDAEKSCAEDPPDLSNGPQLQGDAVAPDLSQKPSAPQELPAEPAGAVVGAVVEAQNKNAEQDKPLVQEKVGPQPQAPVPPEGPPTSEVLTHSRTPSTTEPLQLPAAQDLKARQPSLPATNLPILPPHNPPASVYPLPQTENQRLPYPQPLPQPVGAPSPSSRPQQASSASQDLPSQSPITLPPLAGVLRSSGSPLGPLNITNQQQFKPSPTLPSPRPVQPPLSQSHAVQLPTPRNYPVPVYPYYDSQQQAYGGSYSYHHNHIPPYHHGSQASIPPYQAAPRASRVPTYGTPQLYQTPTPSYSQYSAYSPTSPYQPQQAPVQPQVIRSQVPRFSDQRTPVPTDSSKRRPPRPSPIDTSTTSTRWKNIDKPGSMRSPGSPTRPRPEEISPLSEKAPSPSPEILPCQSQPSKSQSSGKARSDSLGGGITRGRGPRAGSTASSTAADSVQPRTRSQSLLSHADELSMDKSPVQQHKIKPEPAATPAGDEDTSITENIADEGSRKSTRRRQETLREFELAETNRAGTKRKRGPVEAPARASSPFALAFNDSRPNQIFGSRNFPRTSATIMNDISGHKLASMFAKPITDREAPGYKDLIFRPQDLKSIKSAIVAGSKALVSTADSAGAVSASGEIGSPVAQAGGGTPNAKSVGVWIQANADVVPPKGIVNSAQLEKELMRMFANAVMFNPDPRRGFGPAFRKRGGRALGDNGDGEDEDEDQGEEKGGRQEEEEEVGV
ncbi:hypothetical protein MMC29_007458, partial [Sticta canariensis]|nr:hypothetical protein [Sticta canariensis]